MIKRSSFHKTLFPIFVASLLLISPTSALNQAQLDFFAQNNILFYDPEACSPNSSVAGIFPNTKYELTDEELKGLVRVAIAKNSCCLTALKAELSIMVNLYERNGKSYSSIPDYVLNGGWFSSNTISEYDKDTAVSSEYLTAARDIINNGNRTLPQQIYEHDSLGDIISISNDNGTTWITSGLTDRNKYRQGTIIKNKYGSTYIFYQWAGGTESDCGDPFGYFENDPPESTATPNASQIGKNKDYEGNQVFTDTQWEKVQEYRPLYEQAAKEANIPWTMLAAIHVRESNLSRINPNSNGIFQILALDVPVNHENTDEEFLNQAKMAAEILKNSMNNRTDDDAIKYAFYSYNSGPGGSPSYNAQARDLGYTEEQAKNGEGSPYVMNKADRQRDPKYNQTTWGQIKHGPMEYPANDDYGAYIYYLAAGGSSDSTICYSSDAGNMNITQTAINLAWPIDAPNNGTMTPRPEYEAAYKAVDDQQRWTWIPSGGSSCDYFIFTVMRYSGVDPNFTCCGTENQRDYMRQHPELYEEISYTDPNDTSILRSGDILQIDGVPNVYNGHGHIMLYIEIDGEGYTAQASYGDYSGKISKGIQLTDPRGQYKIFRYRGNQ